MTAAAKALLSWLRKCRIANKSPTRTNQSANDKKSASCVAVVLLVIATFADMAKIEATRMPAKAKATMTSLRIVLSRSCPAATAATRSRLAAERDRSREGEKALAIVEVVAKVGASVVAS